MTFVSFSVRIIGCIFLENKEHLEITLTIFSAHDEIATSNQVIFVTRWFLRVKIENKIVSSDNFFLSTDRFRFFIDI